MEQINFACQRRWKNLETFQPTDTITEFHLILTFRRCGQYSVSGLSHSVDETPLTCYEDRVDGYNRLSYNHFNSNPKRFLRQNEIS